MAEQQAGGGEEARRVFDALAALEAIEDEGDRARAISEVLRQQPATTKRLKELRRKYVLDQRAAKVSHRKIAAKLGVSLATVQDIERDYSGSGRNRPKSPRTKSEGDGTPPQ